MLKFLRNPIKRIIKYNYRFVKLLIFHFYRDYIQYALKPYVKRPKKAEAKALQTEVQDEAKVETQVEQDEEVKKQEEDSKNIPSKEIKPKTISEKPNRLLDVLKTIEEQVIGIYHKSKVSEQIQSKLDLSSSISKILENLNILVNKYYVEELKPEHDKFQFRRNHLSIPSLWPAFNRRLVFFLNISNGIFKGKIRELLSHEHLAEIGYNVNT